MIVVARIAAALAIASALATGGVPAAAEEADAAAFTGRPRVTDGDTLTFSVRLFGIDTPETRQRCRNAAGQCYDCGRAVSRAVREIIARQSVTCRPTGETSYGRIVAICSAGGLDLNEAILASGLGVAYRGYLDRVPETRARYLAAEAEARGAGRGLWAGEFVLPERWRRRGERVAGCE